MRTKDSDHAYEKKNHSTFDALNGSFGQYPPLLERQETITPTSSIVLTALAARKCVLTRKTFALAAR